jgi:hypothetical protein
MAFWAAAGVAYFLYIGVLAGVQPRLRRAARLQAAGVCLAGSLVSLWGGSSGAFWWRSVVAPPVALLLAYWAGGLLWTGPMPRVERWLADADARLGIGRLVAAMPRPLVVLFEAAYAGVYPLIPTGLVLHTCFSRTPDPDGFWAVVLITDFVCFGMLPWIQTRPPRALESSAPWASGLRSFNVRLLHHLSIGVNTVPSGHAAEALAVALLLSDAPAPIALFGCCAAASITAGAVFGRYHYAVDALAGWVVALIVWSVAR